MTEKHAKRQKPIEETLCDWTRRDLEKHFELLCEIVADPRYVCTKCGRAAGEKKWLCKPRRM